jgi:hypothetical protein
MWVTMFVVAEHWSGTLYDVYLYLKIVAQDINNGRIIARSKEATFSKVGSKK